jgi:type II secretory pathway component PulF
MTPRARVHLSSVCLALTILFLYGFLLMIFYVPKLEAIWVNAEAELPTAYMWLVSASHAAKANGYILFLMLTLLLVAAAVWRVLSSVQLYHSAT